MLISISRRRRHKKQKSADAQNRSTFLKMLFGKMSGDFGSSLMANFVNGNAKFLEQWKTIDDYVKKSFNPKDNIDDKGHENENEN